MTALTIGISPSWALWVAAHAALLYAAYRFVAPFVARLKPGQRNARADGLDIVYDPSNNQTAVNPQFEIVAVHGLGAHPEHTWEGKSIDKVKPKVHLLRDLLPRAFPTARILSFSYNSDWLVDAPEKTAQQIGHRLAERLAKRRGEALRLPIIFIGHSFGGIVIKQALCVMDRSSIILEDTCGIIFLGTPHQGSSLSIAASLLGKLTALLGSNTALLLTLQSNHNQLSDLEDNFRRVAADKQITSFYETKPTFYLGFSIGCIVNRESARGFAKDPVSIDTDHAGLNKFNSSAHPGFEAIKTVIEKLRAKPLIQQADDVLINKHYTSAKLMIKRLSGEELPMDQCYINLAIVKQVQAKKPSQDEQEAKDSAPKSSPFSLFARLNIDTSSDKSQVQLKDLFSRRKRTDGTEISPRRVLIRGRAGVGKTTLCKKMLHEFVGGGMWRDLFDRVLWVPLRNLKERPAPGYNLERFLFDEFFRLQGDKPGKLFAEETSKALKRNRTLLILDGWDEVNQIATANTDMSRFLCDELLRQPNIIITSRPYATIPVQGQPIDLELETIGFNPTQVDEYIEKTHDKTDTMKVDEIKTFLQRHELVRSLVRIPIQLDAFCYCWDDNNYSNNKVDTMTALYQAIQTSLWKKDIPRLGEEHGIPTAQTNELKHSDQVLIEMDVREEIRFLEHLAFDGLVADRLEFDWGDINRTWAKEIMHDRTRSPGNTLPCLSFLRTSDPSAKSVGQSYHFIHLTFQEYYAARYFVRHWNSHRSFEPNQQSQELITPHRFLRKHKYDARYNIVWRFVAGLLDETEKAGSFFDEIELAPVDVLGPAHQRLVIQCLNEALRLSDEIRKKREDKLYQWVLFERDFIGSATFMRESEIPEGVLHRALRASGDKRVFLDVLRYSQRRLSDATVAALVELFKDEDSYVRESAADTLSKQSTLSYATVAALVELFKDEDSYVRSSAAYALGKQSMLSDVAVAALVELFKDEDRDVRRSAAEALGKRLTLSDATMAALVELCKDEDRDVRRSAADALGKRSTLSDAAVVALVELCKDEDRDVRRSAADALGKQSTLSDVAVAALVELFKDEDRDIRRSAARALGNQSTLSDATMTALVELFKDEDRDVRWSAADALCNQSTLLDATMTALVELFKDKNSSVRRSAARALGKQSTLSDKILDALGVSIQPQTRTQSVPYSLCYSQDVAVFYESFLRRSFREYFSLHVGETFCIINQASVIRKATLQDQVQFQEAIRRARGELEQDLYLPSLDLS